MRAKSSANFCSKTIKDDTQPTSITLRSLRKTISSGQRMDTQIRRKRPRKLTKIRDHTVIIRKKIQGVASRLQGRERGIQSRRKAQRLTRLRQSSTCRKDSERVQFQTYLLVHSHQAAQIRIRSHIDLLISVTNQFAQGQTSMTLRLSRKASRRLQICQRYSLATVRPTLVLPSCRRTVPLRHQSHWLPAQEPPK